MTSAHVTTTSDAPVETPIGPDEEGLIHVLDGEVLDLVAGGCGVHVRCGEYTTSTGGLGVACYWW